MLGENAVNTPSVGWHGATAVAAALDGSRSQHRIDASDVQSGAATSGTTAVTAQKLLDACADIFGPTSHVPAAVADGATRRLTATFAMSDQVETGDAGAALGRSQSESPTPGSGAGSSQGSSGKVRSSRVEEIRVRKQRRRSRRLSKSLAAAQAQAARDTKTQFSSSVAHTPPDPVALHDAQKRSAPLHDVLDAIATATADRTGTTDIGDVASFTQMSEDGGEWMSLQDGAFARDPAQQTRALRELISCTQARCAVLPKQRAFFLRTEQVVLRLFFDGVRAAAELGAFLKICFS